MLIASPGTHVVRDPWSFEHIEPMLLLLVIATAVVYASGLRRSPGRSPRRRWAGWLSLVVLMFALQPPIDSLAEQLASAHMIQHMLIMLVIAPLAVYGRVIRTIVRGAPPSVRSGMGHVIKRTRLTKRKREFLAHPGAVTAIQAAVLWIWHSPVLYEAALHTPSIHVLEHTSFLAVAVAFWTVVVMREEKGGISPGARVLLLFATAIQSMLLAVLLTFAQEPWYPSYALTARFWGLDPISDQQLAGVIMWVPGGMVYVATAIVVIARWLHEIDGYSRQAVSATE